jgi:hypothetical protein
MAKIGFHVKDGRYYYGKLKDDGEIDIYDPENNYRHRKPRMVAKSIFLTIGAITTTANLKRDNKKIS